MVQNFILVSRSPCRKFFTCYFRKQPDLQEPADFLAINRHVMFNLTLVLMTNIKELLIRY